MDIARSSILERVTLPKPYSLLAIISNQEVIKTLDTTKSIRQEQVIGTHNDSGIHTETNCMATPTILIWGTGDQKIEEVRIISAKIRKSFSFLSIIPPNHISTSLGEL
jgi:hypothetical protein